MMKGQDLRIIINPNLPSNTSLEEEFTTEISRRVKRTSMSDTPQFLFFRPQSRPKEEFDQNIAPILKKELPSKDIIFVSIWNNIKENDNYLDDTGFTFKLKVRFILTEGRLDIDRNEEELLKLTNMLIDEYGFRKLEEGEDTEDEEPDTEKTEKSEEIRSQLKGVKEPVTLLILNDIKSKYTTSLLSALEGNVVPYQGVMQATQLRAYKWNNIQIIDPGFPEDIDLVEPYLDQVSKNGKLVIIVIQPRGSEVDFEDKKKKIKSISTREEASWHIVVTMDTENVPSGDQPQENQELEGVYIYSDVDHQIVLKKIVDYVNTYKAPKQARRRWLVFLFYFTSTVVLVPAAAYALSTTCLESVLKFPWFILNKCFYHFQRLLHSAFSFMWTDS